METRRLALNIIDAHFGASARAVVNFLIDRPAQPARVISKTSKVPLSLVRHVLVSLIQHNIVTWEQKETAVVYSAHLGLIIARLRFPWYLSYARELFGREAEMLFEVVIHQGRASCPEAVESVFQKYRQLFAEMSETEAKLKLRDAWVALAGGNCIEIAIGNPRIEKPSSEMVDRAVCVSANTTENTVRIANINPAFQLPSAGDSTPGKKKGARKASSALPASAEKTPVKRGKKKAAAETEQMAELLNGTVAQMPSTSSADPVAERMNASLADENVMWRVCLIKLNHALRSRGIAEVAGFKFGTDIGKIATKVLEVAEMSSNGIVRGQQIEETEILPAEKVRTALEILSREDGGKYLRGLGGDGYYSVNIPAFVELVQRHLVDTAVHDSFSAPAQRIFRLLAMRGLMDQKAIGDASLLPPKDVRSHCHQLFIHGFARVQEVPKSNEISTKSTIFLFGVDYPRVTARLAQNMVKGLHNTLARQRVEEMGEGGAEGAHSRKLLTSLMRLVETAGKLLWY